VDCIIFASDELSDALNFKYEADARDDGWDARWWDT